MCRFLHHIGWNFVKVCCLYLVIFVGIFAFLAGPISIALAQPAYTMNYQGKLATPAGVAVADGTYQIVFRLYTAPTGGVAVWTETRSGVNEVTVDNGLFSVMLGSVTPLTSVNFNQPLYLGVTVEADAEMTPRKALGTVPSAFEARQLGGVASSSFLRSDQADIASGLLSFTGGLISTASSSFTRATFTTATTTNLVINGERFTDLTGTGLTNNSGVLSVATSTLGLLASGDINTSAELAAILTDETGSGNVVFSASPTFTGTLNAAAATLSSTLTLSGSAANIALGSNFLSGDGDDEGVSVDASGNVFTSNQLRVASGTASLPSITLAGDTDTGFFSSTGNVLLFSSNAIARFRFTNTGIVSETSNSFTLSSGTTASTPTYTFTNDTDTGVFRATTDVLGFATGGTERVRIDDSGNVGIGTTSPSQRLSVGATAGNQFLVSSTGVISDGTWQGDVIADTYLSDTLTIGAGSSFANNIITPNSILTTGQTDEYCLTYEGTGTTFEWQVCAAAGLASTDIDTSSELAAIIGDETGSGALVFANSPTLVTPALGTPSSVTLTNGTGLPVSTGISGLGTGVATWLATPSSANLRTVMTDETGNGGGLVFASEPTFIDTGGLGGGSITLGTSGMTLSTDGDGAISFFGLGDGFDENLTLNLDDTANTGVFTSGSGLNIINFSGIALQESGSNILSVGDVDTSSELAAILGDETGTGNVVFSASPTFTGTPVLPSSFTIGANTFARAGAHALTLTNTAPTNVTLPTSGTLYGTAASSITSAQLLSSLSDETGTGVAVFGTSPTFTTSANFGTAGVRISDDGDGAITFLGLGNGFDENLILNFDDVTNTISASSTTGVNTFLFEGITQSVSKFNDYGQYINGYNSIIHTTGYDFQTGASINAGVSVTGGSYDVKGQEILVSIDDSGPGLSQVWGTIIQTGIGENTADITYGEQIIAQSNSGTVYGLFVDAAVYGPGSAYAAIFNTGNVGIGTSTPSQALSIGATTSSQFLVSNLGVVSDGTWQGDVISSAYIDAATILSTEIDSSSELAAIVGDETGSGALVFATSPTLVTPNLGTPSSLTLTNATGLPVATGISGLGTGVATWLATPSSANLSTAITDETGTGALVFAGSPTFTGTISAAAATLSSTLTLSGTAANIALGSNYLSGDGGDEGVFVSSTGRVGIGTNAPSDTFEVVGDIVSKGTAWTARSAAGNDDSWSSVTYGNGLFVAVSFANNRVMTSPDGINWTARSAAGDNDSWVSVTYGNGLFVAVGPSGDRVMTSSDGINWTTRSAAGNDDSWYSVTYGNGLFVAVGASGDRVMTSPDGINWTTRSAAGNDDNWNGVTYGNGLFVAVGSSGDYVMTSPDGITWNARSAAGDNDNWSGVTYGNGLFVAVGVFGDYVMTSPDGITWNARSAAGNDDQWTSVTYGNGLFVAVGASGDRVMTSPDGITWTTRSAAGNDDQWYGIIYGNGLFVAVGRSGDRVMTSGRMDENRLATNNLYQGGSVLFGNAQFGTTTLGTVGTNAQLSIQSSGSQDVLNLFGSTGSGLFIVQNGGNVGIGTSSPSSKLTVAGDLRVTGAFLDTSGDAGTSGQVLLSTLTGTNWTATSTLGLGNGSFLGLNDTFNSYNANRIPYSSASALIDSSSFTFDGTRLAVGSVPGVGTLGSGLVVSRNSPSTGLTAASVASFHNRETSTSAGQSTGILSNLEAAPTANTSRSYYGSISTVFGTPSAERDTGLLFGSASNVYVGQLNPTGVVGALGQVNIQNALATVPVTAGVSGVVVASAGSATQIIGLTSELYVEGATIDQAVGVYIPRNIVTSGSLNTSIGLLMGPQDNGTENWNLYIQGATTDNYIAGNLGLGTTSPSQQLTIGATTSSQFLVSSAGVILDGTWQGDVITDTYLSDTLTIGASSTFANNIITPNSILTTGQTDEYCLTYEGTGTTFEWQTCGAGGGSLFTDGGANTYLTATGDNLSIGGTGGSARLNVYGDIDVASAASGISFMGTRMFYASTTNDAIYIGELAGSGQGAGNIYNVAIGYGSAQNATGANADYGVYVGYEAGYNNSALFSNFYGYRAGYNNSGTYVNLHGYQAGYGNTGNDVNAYGQNAGQNNTGANNNLFGKQAGQNATGANNNAFGERAGQYAGIGNNYFGLQAGQNVTGNYNIAIGQQALLGNNGGGTQAPFSVTGNIALGYRAGYNATTTASNNILLGYQVADNLTTGNNNIIIGYDIDNITATTDNALNIGNLIFGTGLDGTGTTLSSGNIGIGDTTPDAKLDLSSEQTSGTLIGYALDGIVSTLTGSLTGMDLDLSTAYTATGQSVTGYNTTLPTVTNTGAGTYNYRGLTVTGNALTQTTAAGVNTFTGAFITNSNLTQTTGTLSANGVSVTTGTNTTGGTQQGFNVIGQGVGAGTLNALNIANITGGAGTENAINIGTGYDNIINSTPFDIAGTGQTTLTPLTTFTSGTLFSIGAGGATTLSAAYTGLSVNLRNNFIATSQSVTALTTQVPNVANTGGGTYNYNAASFGTSGGTLSQAVGAGTNNYRGAYIFTPNITQSAGTVTANGVVVETGTITTGGTQNGINVTAQGVGAGTLNGINIANITAGAGTENAINVGTGYDTIFNSATLDITGAGAITGATGITSSGTTTLSSLNNAGAVLFTDASGVLTQDITNFIWDNTNNRLGIGDASPDTFLDVEGNAADYIARFFNDGNNENRYGLRIDAGADDGSGTTYYLDAYDGDGTQVGYLANVAGTFGVTDISDIRTKTNVTNTEIVDATAVIQGLRVVDFNRLQDPNGPRITGFIAQEVQAVFPYAVTENPKTGYLGIMKDAFVPLLVKGAQEQQVAIAEQGGLLSTLGASLMDTIQSVGDLEAAVTSGLSENYKTDDDSIEAGEIVSLDTNESATIKRAEAGERIFGVVATTPGLVLGQSVNDAKPVALSGRVPVKVNLEGGDINVGDAITLSSEAGIGTKATTTGRVLGTALEATDENGVIEIFVEPAAFYAPEVEQGLASLFAPIEENQNDTLWGRITTLASNFIDGVLTVAGVKTDELCVGSVCVDEEAFLEMVESAGGSQVPSNNGNGGDLPPAEEPPAPEGGGGEAPPAEEPPAPESPPEPPPEPAP